MTTFNQDPSSSSGSALAAFGAGCFWCIEAVYEKIKGVLSVRSGYMGGHTQSPTYREVCSGTTGHAEVIQIMYDPDKIDYEKLLDIFWKAHDPTQLNRQGGDMGTQYRSAIFYYNDEQKNIAERSKNTLNDSGQLKHRVVTEIVEASPFYEAEAEHQKYYLNNPGAPYCIFNIKPKLGKLGVGKIKESFFQLALASKKKVGINAAYFCVRKT
ncbi:MAG: peptide-methionine (S)-S-oxide reductase MsrA [Kiritimatiellae bacterium]|nr:peptide-methionine (S)-S-oxide reductase MsrA [Kiritimatiellia bacterium]